MCAGLFGFCGMRRKHGESGSKAWTGPDDADLVLVDDAAPVLRDRRVLQRSGDGERREHDGGLHGWVEKVWVGGCRK